jgi:hypothetical protein
MNRQAGRYVFFALQIAVIAPSMVELLMNIF